MARQTKRKRRAFGHVKPTRKHGRDYLEYSYATPVEAFSRWPGLPQRCYKLVPKEFEWEGEAWLAAAQTAIKAGTWTPPQSEKEQARRDSLTFREFAVPWVEHRKKPDGTDLKETAKQKYRESLDLYLLPWFGDRPMTSITPKDVQAWFDAFRPVRHDADLADRRAHVYRHLRTMMRSAAEEPMDDEGHTLITSNPCRLKVGKPAVKHTPVRPTREQLDMLIAVMPEWVRLVVLLCDGAGLREGEALGLRRRHIDLKGLTIQISEQVQRVTNPKTGKGETVTLSPKTRSSIRTVPMTRALADRLAAWMEQRGITDPDAHLFTSDRTGGVHYGQHYRNAFAKAREQVSGLETMRPHDLRKDCLSRMMEMGATVSEVMAQGGHSTMAVASRYQVTGEQHLNEVMARMNEHATAPSASTAQPSADHGESATGKPATVSDAGEAELQSLAGVLAGMEAVERAAVLKPLPVERRVRVLELLPAPVRVETMTRILGEVES